MKAKFDYYLGAMVKNLTDKFGKLKFVNYFTYFYVDMQKCILCVWYTNVHI